MHAIRAQSRDKVNAIRQVILWPSNPTKGWTAGFLAGIFDAEGSFSQTIWRIPNTDPEIIGWICSSLESFGFRFVVEHLPFTDRKPMDVVRMLGGLKEHLRFFHTVNPAITRKL